MTQNVSFFLPVRKGSQRVINKNTRPFSNLTGGILELKLRQLLECRRLTEVVLSTNDERAIEIAFRIDPEHARINVVERPEHLCLDTTSLTALIAYVPEVVKSEHILWGHTTTPFVNGADYDKGIDTYFEKLEQGYDSLVSTMTFQNFLLDATGRVLNYDAAKERWPRTQDLTVLYEVNHAMFISSRSHYLRDKDRVGKRPFLYIMDKIKSFDIDWEEDFEVAELLYKRKLEC